VSAELHEASGPRAFFARLVLTGRRLSPAGREIARAQYLAAVEAELAAAAERRTRTLAGMAAVLPPDRFHTHTGRR
jgi:hypothetical protein